MNDLIKFKISREKYIRIQCIWSFVTGYVTYVCLFK